MRAQIVFWRIGGMLALCALAGCFEQLPEADACNTSADCLLRERCAANRCIPQIIDERDQAEDMLKRPDLDAPELIETPDMEQLPDMMPDMLAGPTVVVIQIQDAETPGTLISDVPVCIFPSSFVDVASAGADVTRRVSNEDGVITLQLEAAGLSPSTKYRIWTGLADRGEGDVTNHIPYEGGEIHTFPSVGMMKIVTINVEPCDNSIQGKECPNSAKCVTL